MAGLTNSQQTVILALIDSAPDSAIRSLDLALSSETRADGPMAAIRDLVSAEAGERRTRNLVFAPLTALCASGEPSYPRKTFPFRTIARLWLALKTERPADTDRAMTAASQWPGEGPAPEIFDALVRAAALGLRAPAGTPYAATAILLDEAEPGGAETFAEYLDLTPLARVAITRLNDWLGRMTPERAAEIRLAFRDATDIAKDAGPRFVEILAARLEEPWQILRIISAVMDRPHDSFLAASELSHIGERILGEMDKSFDDLKSFDPLAGAAAGASAAEAVRLISTQVTELEQSIDLKRDGPWGSRVIALKKLTAQKVEAVMVKADAALADALPLKAAKFGSKRRASPRFDALPRPEAVAKAEGMLAFMEKVRGPAATGGYASARAKVIEQLDDRLDSYVEDVLEHLRTDEPEHAENARTYLDHAARFVGLLRDEKAAQIVRRRGAA